jgi:hypothetical protein
MNQQCKVCGEPAAGFHFGAFTCEGCKVRLSEMIIILLPFVRVGICRYYHTACGTQRYSGTQSHLADETINSNTSKSASHIPYRLRICPFGGKEKIWGYQDTILRWNPFKVLLLIALDIQNRSESFQRRLGF